MQRQKFRAELVLGLRDAFALLMEAAAEQRWAVRSPIDALRCPVVGLRYVSRQGSRLRSGHIAECIRPVALTLAESLLDPPCHVQLRLRYRLEPAENGTLLQLDVGQAMNAAATMRKRYWVAEIGRECAELLSKLAHATLASQGTAGCKGQKMGSSSMTVANTTNVSGRPSLK